MPVVARCTHSSMLARAVLPCVPALLGDQFCRMPPIHPEPLARVSSLRQPQLGRMPDLHPGVLQGMPRSIRDQERGWQCGGDAAVGVPLPEGLAICDGTNGLDKQPSPRSTAGGRQPVARHSGHARLAVGGDLRHGCCRVRRRPGNDPEPRLTARARRARLPRRRVRYQPHRGR